MRRLGALMIAASLAAAVLGACSESKYTFVVSGSENISIKIPRSWKVFSMPTGAQDRLAPDSPGDVDLLWSRGFDGDPNPAEKHIAAMTNFGQVTVYHPVGLANVYRIQGSYNQKVSLTEARKAILGVDPMYVNSDVQSLVEILDYQPVTRFRDLQGSRVRFNLRSTSDTPWSTYEMLSLFDQGSYRMYTLIVGCIGPCFEESSREIAEVVDSWRFER